MTLWWLMVVMTHWWLLYQQVQKQDNRGQRRPPYMKPIQNNPEQLLYDFYMGRFKSVERAIFIFPIPVCKVGWSTLWHESESGMYLESCAKSVERARAGKISSPLHSAAVVDDHTWWSVSIVVFYHDYLLSWLRLWPGMIIYHMSVGDQWSLIIDHTWWWLLCTLILYVQSEGRVFRGGIF